MHSPTPSVHLMVPNPTPEPRRPRLGEFLLEKGLLTPDQLEDALKAQLIYGGRLGTCLVELGYVDPTALTELLAELHDVRAVNPAELVEVPIEVLERITPQLAELHQVVPFRSDGRRLHVALADPEALQHLDELSGASGQTIVAYLAPENVVRAKLDYYYDVTHPERHVRVAEPPRAAAPVPTAAAPTAAAPAAQPATPSLAPPSATPPTAAPAYAPTPPRAAAPPAASPRAASVLPPAARTSGPRVTSLAEAVRFLQTAEHPNRIVDLLVDFPAQFFERVAVFRLSHQGYVLHRTNASETRARSLAGVTIGIEWPVFGRSLAGPGYHFGRLPEDPTSRSLVEALGQSASAPVFVIPLKLPTRLELVLVGGPARPQFSVNDVRTMKLLLEKCSIAFQLIVLKNRLQFLPPELH